MAHLDPQDASAHLQERVLEGIQTQFPLKGKLQTLQLDKLEVKDDQHPDDIRTQQAAKVSGGTWSVPVYAHLSLKDNATGKTIDQQRVRLVDLPKMTRRYSYIIEGKEYQVDNQWLLKPGIYARRRTSGELESHFNVIGKGVGQFRITLNPETKQFSMLYGASKAHLPIYPFLKTMGVEDQDLEKAWGKEIFEANKNAGKVNTALDAFYKTTKKTAPPDREAAAANFYEKMQASTLRPDATEITVGKAFTNVTGDALKLATEKLLKVHAGHPEDDRDSLVFKDLRTAGDFAHDALRDATRTIQDKTTRKVNSAKSVRDVIKFDFFNKPVLEAFKHNAASRQATQINPVEMASSALQTTVMGTGGIKSELSITDAAKFVGASHLGFLDPIHTPEGEKTGVTLRMPVGVTLDGHEVKIRLHNLRTGKMDMVSPAQFMKANVVLPDQVTWEHDKPKPIGKAVRMSTSNNEIRDGKFEDATYVMPKAWQLFNMTSNLIPFLANTSGGRASMASRQMEQAISLEHRAAPLVQVSTGMKSSPTFEDLMGHQASHRAPFDAKVVEIKKDAIILEDKGGAKHEVQIYNNYPLNEAKAVMHSTPVVKVGDSVKKGHVIADTNYSKDGILALGTNLRTAYIPFKGYNFEDGIVISRSAAEALSSAHLQKAAIPVDKDLILNKSRFHLEHPGLYKKEQYAQLDSEGVIRPGTHVKPGDPLVAAMKPYALKDRTGLAAIRRSMSGGHTDKSLIWDSEFEGDVVGVHKSKDGLTVHVRTVEPMQVGDKMAGRYGNKGIVTMILDDKEMPHTKDGKHIEVALNPSGVPGRMNVGQLLETAAGKIAQKTGKPYIVQNFAPNTDSLAEVRADLKKHGISDTEELFDPATGQSLGQVMVGPQHHLKLVHQVEKKLSVRSGMVPYHGGSEGYDANLQPTGGSTTGGQSMGTLGLYALLAHGAKANIREMQSYKSEGPDPQTNPSKRWDSNHDKIWSAIQTGGGFPTPKPTFAFEKFTHMLKGLGVNVEKKGNDLSLTPMTDEHIRNLAQKELPNAADILMSKSDKNGNPKPKPGGLFDEALTGGHGGRRWTRIRLAEPVPNPVFESPIRALTGLSKKDFVDIVQGAKGVTPNGNITDSGAGVTGGAGIKLLLDRVDVAKDLPKAKAALMEAKGPKLDPALKKVKYLRALQQTGMKPGDAYILHNVPVLPPVMRPIALLPDGNPKFADINQLYSDFAKTNDKLKDPTLSRHLTDEGKKDLRKDFYGGVQAIMGFGTYAEVPHKGLLHQITGSAPKHGFFQDVLVNRRQDLTMRSTIVPEPSLGLDEVGIPKHAALDLYRPFVVRKLADMGAIANEMQGPALIAKKTPAVWRALDKVMEERPLLLKRDPALHKYSVQAFKAKPVEGNAIKIHPLVTGGFNADFDGDSIDLDTPLLLRIQEQVTMRTGRELIALLDAEDGNYVVETKGIDAWTYAGWRPVKTVSFHEVVDKKKYKVTLKNGVSFIASEDHSLMSGRKEVKPGALCIGTALDYGNPSPKDVASTSSWSYEKGVAYGNFLGYGCAEVRRQGGGRISIACLPLVEREYLMNIWRKEFPNANPSEYVYGFHVNGVDLARHFLEVCGRYCNGKFIGDRLFNRGVEFLKGMLSGYILADGSVEVTRSGSYLIRTWSRSKRLRDGMSFIATMLGLPHALRERTAKGEVNYIISFGKEAIKLIDFRCAGKKGDLIRQARHAYENFRQDARTSQSERGFEVLSIEEVEYHDRMVDLEVEGNSHVFALLGGVIVHNTMSAFVPVTREAMAEAHKMFPSNNLFSEASGKVMFQPTLESALGLYKLSLSRKDTGKKFAHPGNVLDAVRDGSLHMNDIVHLSGKKTTAGRVLLASALPDEMQHSMLYSLDTQINGKGLDKLLTQVAKEHSDRYGETVNRLKDLGNGAAFGTVAVPQTAAAGHQLLFRKLDGAPVATREKAVSIPMGAHTLSLEDFEPDVQVRSHILGPADKEAEHIRDDKKLTQGEKDQRVIAVYKKATNDMRTLHEAKQDKNPSNLFTMYRAGVKPGWEQYKQMVLAPMIYTDSSDRDIPMPVTKSYAEGLDVGSYWTQMHGARRGAVMKVQEVSGPGYLSKQLMNNMMNMLVDEHDCGTTKGIALDVGEPDLHDRYLQQDFTHGKLHIPAGELLTPDLIAKVRAAKPNAQLIVRSPLKCESEKGICQKCAGLSANGHMHELGTNVGVHATHAIGERAMQLTLKSFHMGGVSEQQGSKLLSSFSRFQQLMDLNKTIPNEATIAMVSGKIDRIQPTATGVDVYVGAHKHHVGKDVRGIALNMNLPNAEGLVGYQPWKPPVVGMHVEAGDNLSDPNRTFVNPRHIYAATGSMEKVQNHLTNEIYKLYKETNIKRRAVETVVKAMSNLTEVVDPGGHPDLLRHEFRPLTSINKMNKELAAQKLPLIEHKPVLKGIDALPLEMQEDWMAKLQHEKLRATLLDAAATSGVSHLHGVHPIPGLAFGAEFGLTKKDSLTPGREHLKGVPAHHY